MKHIRPVFIALALFSLATTVLSSPATCDPLPGQGAIIEGCGSDGCFRPYSGIAFGSEPQRRYNVLYGTTNKLCVDLRDAINLKILETGKVTTHRVPSQSPLKTYDKNSIFAGPTFVPWRPVSFIAGSASPPESHSSVIWGLLMSGWPLMSVQIPYMNDGEAFTVFLSGQYAQWFNTFETPDVTRTENGGVDATDYLHAQPVSVPPFPGCRHGVVDPLLASDTFVPRCRQKALKSVDNPLLKADLKAVRSGKVMSTLQFLIFKGVYYAAFISRDLDAISVVKVSRSNFEEMCYLKSNVRLVSR